MSHPLHILLVEDSPSDAELIQIFIEKSPLRTKLHRVETIAAALVAIDEASKAGDAFEAALLDLALPDSTGLETYRRLAAHQPELPVIILSGLAGDEIAVAAVKEGAQDYLPKSEMSSSNLARAIRYSVERHERILEQHRLAQLEHDMQTAATIQKRLLPQVPANIPGLDIAALSVPADATGGDFYDFFRLPNGLLGAMIADVSGHGLGASFIMASTMGAIRSLIHDHADPGKILTAANQQVFEDTSSGHFVTAFCGILDPTRGEMLFANAGHGGWLLHESGAIESLDAPGGFPLGIAAEHVYQASPVIRLTPGTSLIMLTDGLHEAASPDGGLFTMDRVHATLRDLRGASAAELVDGTLATVSQFCHPSKPLDDMTMVALTMRQE